MIKNFIKGINPKKKRFNFCLQQRQIFDSHYVHLLKLKINDLDTSNFAGSMTPKSQEYIEDIFSKFMNISPSNLYQKLDQFFMVNT